MVQKPWGYYQDILRTPTMVFKKIVVRPKQGISLQIHNNRDETWCIEDGCGIFTRDGFEFRVCPSAVVHISAGEAHRVVNQSDVVDLVIYELQYGKYDEEDIVRLEDFYGREEKA